MLAPTRQFRGITMQNNPAALGTATVAFHWIVAAGFIFLLALGLYIENAEARQLMGLHKSLGLALLVPVLARILWRVIKGFPEYANSRPFERLLSRITHYGLLALSIVMPVGGIMMSVASGRGLYLFGRELIANNPDPANPGKMLALSEPLASIGHIAHGVGANLALLLLALHIAGALKHHFIDRDIVLKRMMGRT